MAPSLEDQAAIAKQEEERLRARSNPFSYERDAVDEREKALKAGQGQAFNAGSVIGHPNEKTDEEIAQEKREAMDFANLVDSIDDDWGYDDSELDGEEEAAESSARWTAEEERTLSNEATSNNLGNAALSINQKLGDSVISFKDVPGLGMDIAGMGMINGVIFGDPTTEFYVIKPDGTKAALNDEDRIKVSAYMDATGKTTALEKEPGTGAALLDTLYKSQAQAQAAALAASEPNAFMITSTGDVVKKDPVEEYLKNPTPANAANLSPELQAQLDQQIADARAAEEKFEQGLLGGGAKVVSASLEAGLPGGMMGSALGGLGGGLGLAPVASGAMGGLGGGMTLLDTSAKIGVGAASVKSFGLSEFSGFAGDEPAEPARSIREAFLGAVKPDLAPAPAPTVAANLQLQQASPVLAANPLLLAGLTPPRPSGSAG